IVDNTNKKYIREAIAWLGSISYEIFLLQHIVIVYVLKVLIPSNDIIALGLLFITTFLIISVASILHLSIKKLYY
ncbi:MAG: hypothetical protein Q4F92_06740, partial [Acidaminococcus sp.]